MPGLTRLRLQIIAMRNYQEKVVHMLLLVVRFAILDTKDYFTLVAFQMARLTLYVAWHVVLSLGDCDVHVQILTCLDRILLKH
jgi:NAD/NADP transhydrogenase beta subunit